MSERRKAGNVWRDSHRRTIRSFSGFSHPPRVLCPSPTPRGKTPKPNPNPQMLTTPCPHKWLSSHYIVVYKEKRIDPDLDNPWNRRRGGDWRRDRLPSISLLIVLVLLGHRRYFVRAELVRVEAGSRGDHVLRRLRRNGVVRGVVRLEKHGVVRFAGRHEELRARERRKLRWPSQTRDACVPGTEGGRETC